MAPVISYIHLLEMKKLSAILLMAAAVSGCGENTPVQTIDWYQQHDAERREMIAKCKVNPGELAASPNCINSQQADNKKANARRGWLKLDAAELDKNGG